MTWVGSFGVPNRRMTTAAARKSLAWANNAAWRPEGSSIFRIHAKLIRI